MIAFKTIQPSFAPNKHTLLHSPSTLANNTRRTSTSRILTLCSTNSNDKSSSKEGDPSQQERLAAIAMLQAEKVRLTSYLDKKSDSLIKFAEDANAEFDKIGQEAFKRLEESSAKRMEKMESEMQAFEESAELNRQQIERNERKIAEFENQVERDRNEGLFFKSLGRQDKPVDQAEAEQELKKIEEVTKERVGSKTRRNVYLVFMGLVSVGIADVFISSPPDWRKVAVLGGILVALINQFTYEQEMLSETEKIGKERSEKK